jgi:hypothetical protein
LGDLLARTARTGRLDATVRHLSSDGLDLEDVSLQKRAGQLSATARLQRSALEHALPIDLRLVDTHSRKTLDLDLTAKVLGRSITAAAQVEARKGRLQIASSLPLLSLFHITLFADPRISIDAVSAADRGSSYEFQASARLV